MGGADGGEGVLVAARDHVEAGAQIERGRVERGIVEGDAAAAQLIVREAAAASTERQGRRLRKASKRPAAT